MEDNTIKVLFAIAALTILEVCALLKGINGQVFATIVAVIAGLAGYTLSAAVKARSTGRSTGDRSK